MSERASERARIKNKYQKLLLNFLFVEVASKK